jgi:5-hydroxyisourate hydrolase-like protein (transthyretin family)
MRLPARLSIILTLLFCGACLCQRANSQTKPKNADATVSGKVTLKGKPAPGIVVGIRLSQAEQSSPTFKATTDQDGVYHISNVPSGNYWVAPVAPALVISDVNNSRGQAVIITESENVDGIDFELVRGGVITGRVIDADGHPILEERITLSPADERNQRGSVDANGSTTDDRGIYRIFGVPAGRYKVSVGGEGSRFNRGSGRKSLPQTFYPDAADSAKAGIVEIDEGTEATKIDITVGQAVQGFSVSGRILDGETANPVPNVGIMLNRILFMDANNSRSYTENSEVRSDAQGQFRITDVRPGKYQISFYAPEIGIRAEQQPTFDVVDQDVTGLILKTSKGASIAGSLVFEGTRNDTINALLSRVWVMVYTRSEGNSGMTSGGSVRVKPDGSFFAGGLMAGTANFSIETGGNNKGLTLLRIEREGVPQPNGIQIQNRDQISGVRLVVTFSSGSIRGIVRVENGTLPAGAHLIIQLSRPDDPNLRMGGSQVDARGHFLLEGLAAGNYELRVSAYVPEMRRRPPTAKQIVTVADGAATDVILTLDLTPTPNP